MRVFSFILQLPDLVVSSQATESLSFRDFCKIFLLYLNGNLIPLERISVLQIEFDSLSLLIGLAVNHKELSVKLVSKDFLSLFYASPRLQHLPISIPNLLIRSILTMKSGPN